MQLFIKTLKKKQIVDITEIINQEIREKNVSDGLCNIFIKHTTAALTTADLDPGTDLDMLDAFAELIPKLKYRHPHNPAHVPDHILSSLIGPSLVIPIKNKELNLGTWQRVVLIELDGPREREVILNILK